MVALRVLITGVANHWGTELALRLTGDDRVIGVDTRRPDRRLEGRIDITKPLYERCRAMLEKDHRHLVA